MFGSSRKHRAQAQPLTKETANPNAATAAASAFMRREPAPTTLSSAAAAAALKARPMTPTNVSEVQSKRTVRRSSSISSTRSQDRSAGRQLRRAPSTSSMTERTFRSPSPGRSPAPVAHNVPPVPIIPKDRAQQRPQSAHNPTMTIQTQPFRTASQKLKDGQQGSWFGAARGGDAANVRTSDAVLHHAATEVEVSEPRPGSISPSINFSYPRARHESPAPSTASASETIMVYDANSRRMVPKVDKADLLDRYQSVRSASEKPVKKKKQVASKIGIHFAQGNVNRTKTAPIEALQAVSPISEPTQTASQPTPEVPEAPEVVAQVVKPPEQPLSRAEEEMASHTEPTLVANVESRAEANLADEPPVMPSVESNDGHVLHKKPSTVLEEPETEERAEATEAISSKPYTAIGAVPALSSQGISGKGSPAPAIDEPPHHPVESNPQHGSVRRTRVHSESPARSPGRAHFAPTADQLLVRHEPPPRSLSPRKSALKQSSSVRGASPSDDSSEASGPFSKDDAAARKKAARVSFNEDYNVVLGESAEPPENESPVLLSPQVKHKPWRNFMSRNKKDSSVEDDETMSPRPALPLFGSVREKKTKEPDNERPLVRPGERTWSPPPQKSGSQGASADSAIGTVLAHELSTKNEANISKTREPLPPVVQSIEGNGYISSSTESSDDEQEDADATKPSQVLQSTPSVVSDITAPSETAADFVETQQADKVVVSSPQAGIVPPPTQSAGHVNGSTVKTIAGTGEKTVSEEGTYVPSISIINATPPAKSQLEGSPDSDYFDVPGGYPEDAPKRQAIQAEGENINTAVTVDQIKTTTEPEISIPGPDLPPSPSRAEAGAGGLPMADIVEEEESDHSSIYSDAYEDLSDVGMDGFMSLDAVLEAPPKSQVSKLYEKTVTESKAHASLSGASKVMDAEPLKTPDDWENAKAYWKSLTVEKRRQLEKEAIEEAGEEADQEAFSKPKKTKKRRSTDRPPSRHEPGEAAINPERVYQIQPGTSWDEDHGHVQSGSEAPVSKGFRKSMRGEQPPKVEPTKQAGMGLRKSMRSNGTSGDAQSSVSGRDLTTAPRPSSYHVGASVEPPKHVRRALSAERRPMSASGPLSAGTKPTLRRRGSDSSESSFKRARSNTGEGFGFRRTMRAQSQEPESPRATNGSGRFSIRSLSPTGSGFRRPMSAVSPASNMGGGRMRTSLRAAPAVTKEKRFSTFGRSSGKKAKKSLGGSRFGNSSDEEDGPSLFTSRFAESSDEEDPSVPSPKPSGFAAKTMRTNKGTSLPATFGRSPIRSDSPDLPDSDDDVPQVTQAAVANGQARPFLQRNRSSGRGSVNGAVPGGLSTAGVADRPTHRRRGSFMSSILGRKKDTASKISRDTSESAARRDTNLERSTEQLAILRSNSGGQIRLQKRGANWPLPDDEAAGRAVASPQVDRRPATSGGPGSAPAPRGFLKRRSLSAQQVPPVPPIPAVPKTQMTEVPPERSQMTDVHPDATLKKKKFGTLRKMFGLTD